MAEVSRRFRICTKGTVGPRRWWWVVIHPGLEPMRAAAHRYRPEPDGRASWNRTMACHQPTPYLQHDVTGERRFPAGGYAGIIRLARGSVTAELVAHELLHAAVWAYRMNVTWQVRINPRSPREEDLAILYGELFASFQDRY